MGVRQASEINKIGKSPEMAPWDVPGKYSRPVCRRILEEAGIFRNIFGISKKAASVLFDARSDTLTSATRDEYHSWLRRNSKGRRWYAVGRLLEWFHWPYRFALRGCSKAVRMAPEPLRSTGEQLSRRLQNLERDVNLFRHIFPWAIENAKDRYGAYHQRSMAD
jgi:hypothetical protein